MFVFIDDETGVTTTISTDPIFRDVVGFQASTDFVTEVMYNYMTKVIKGPGFYEAFEDAEEVDVALVLWDFSKGLSEVETGDTCASTFVYQWAF